MSTAARASTPAQASAATTPGPAAGFWSDDAIGLADDTSPAAGPAHPSTGLFVPPRTGDADAAAVTAARRPAAQDDTQIVWSTGVVASGELSSGGAGQRALDEVLRRDTQARARQDARRAAEEAEQRRQAAAQRRRAERQDAGNQRRQELARREWERQEQARAEADRQPDHYRTLNLEPTATAAQIEAAYQKLAPANQPDGNSHDPGATARLQEAYEVLTHPRKRADYDADRLARLRPVSSTPPPGWMWPVQWLVGAPSAGPHPPQPSGPPPGWVPVRARGVDGPVIYVNPANVMREVVRGRNHRNIGMLFTSTADPGQLGRVTRWARSDDQLIRYVRTLPHETPKEALAADRADAELLTPWWRDYEDGGHGPVFVFGHGLPDWLTVHVGAGFVWEGGQFSFHVGDVDSRADGTTAWRLLRGWRAFNALLAANPDASVVMIVCRAVDGGLSDRVVAAMREDRVEREAHSGHSGAHTDRDARGLPYTGAAHNGGFDTYLRPDQDGRTQRIASPYTRYEADEIESYRKSSS